MFGQSLFWLQVRKHALAEAVAPSPAAPSEAGASLVAASCASLCPAESALVSGAASLPDDTSGFESELASPGPVSAPPSFAPPAPAVPPPPAPAVPPAPPAPPPP